MDPLNYTPPLPPAPYFTEDHFGDDQGRRIVCRNYLPHGPQRFVGVASKPVAPGRQLNVQFPIEAPDVAGAFAAFDAAKERALAGAENGMRKRALETPPTPAELAALEQARRRGIAIVGGPVRGG